MHLVKNEWNYTSTPLYTFKTCKKTTLSVFIRQTKFNKLGKVNWETDNFGWTDVLLFGKQPIHQNAMKMEARDGQYGGMTLKPVNLKSQHVEVLLNPWKISQKSWLVQEDFEQKDNLSSFPQTWKTAAKDWGDSILFATGSPLVSRFSVIWSDIPAYNSNIRGTVRSILNSAETSLPFHFTSPSVDKMASSSDTRSEIGDL